MNALTLLLWAAFGTLVVVIGAVLLPACGLLTSLSTLVPGTGWNFCAAAPATLIRAENEALGRRAQELDLQIARQSLACLTMSGAHRQPAAASAARPAEPGSLRQPSTAAKPPLATQPSAKQPSVTGPKTPVPAGDYAFLKGCWQTDPFRHVSSEPLGLSTYCFDEDGAGQLEYRRVDQPDYTCRLAVQASIQGEQVRLRDSDGRCSDGTAWYADILECSRGTGDVADCHGTTVTPSGNQSFPLRLHRMK